jgi:hypothetical protein
LASPSFKALSILSSIKDVNDEIMSGFSFSSFKKVKMTTKHSVERERERASCERDATNFVKARLKLEITTAQLECFEETAIDTAEDILWFTALSAMPLKL